MARYEVALSTPAGFTSVAALPFSEDETVCIECEGRTFVWHARRVHDGAPCWPVVTVMLDDPDDYADECLATNRFLSALCFTIDYPISVVTSAATGYKQSFDPPLLAQPGDSARVLIPPVSGLRISPDNRLSLVLALYREARSAESPFYRFLAFYNSLDAAFDNDEPARDSFIRAALASAPLPPGWAASDWAHYMRDALRNAVAHAVRPPGKPVLNPDDLVDRRVIDEASSHLVRLIRARTIERWPGGVDAL